jgi:hypothetical protein
VNAEGWYRDPFDQHVLRWFSAGRPTDLVRDEDVEAYDPPPQDEWEGPLLAYVPPPTVDELGPEDLLRAGQIGAESPDLLRADDAEAAPYDPSAPADAALDRGAASGLGFD